MAETTTPGHLLKKYDDGDTPGAANLNFNWDTIDTRLMGVGSSFPTTYAVTGLFLRTDQAKLYENTGTTGTPVWTLRLNESAFHAATHQHGGADEVATATPAANAIPKAGAGGAFADGWVPETAVTQHEGAIDHDALTNFEVTEHRVINDSGTSTTELWSADKIGSELAAVVAGVDIKAGVDTTTEGLGDITLSGEQTLNGLPTSASRVLVTEQTDDTENGIYVSDASTWSRAADADEDAEVTNGNVVHVINSGSDKFKRKYLLVTADPITVGGTAQAWEEHKDIDFGTTTGTATEGDDSRVPSQDENDALAGTSGTPSSSNKYVTNADPRNSDARTPTAHNHAAGDVNSGTFDNARVAESSVTQHEGAIDHDALTNFEVTEHRVINDSGTSTTELWSADKIDSAISAVVAGIDIKAGVDTTTEGLGDITLSGEQTLNGLSTSASRVLVTEQTDDTENGIYVTDASTWSRAADADEDAEVTNGNVTHVINSGSDKFKYKYLLVTADPIEVGVTGQTWEEHRDIDFGTTSGTATEGDDSRVPTQDENDALVGTSGTPSTSNKYVTNADPRNSDNRTDAAAIHDNVAAEIVAVEEKTAPDGDDEFLGEDSTASNAKKSYKLKNLRDLDFWQVNAEGSNPTTSGDRPAGPTANAPAIKDTVNAGLYILSYDDTVHEIRSLGTRRIKAKALTLNIKALWRAQTTPGDALHDIGWKLWWREIPDGTAAPSTTWTGGSNGSKTLAEIVDIANDVLFHESGDTLTLVTEGILLDREYEFAISRIAPAGTNLAGNWNVRRFTLTLKG